MFLLRNLVHTQKIRKYKPRKIPQIDWFGKLLYVEVLTREN